MLQTKSSSRFVMFVRAPSVNQLRHEIARHEAAPPLRPQYGRQASLKVMIGSPAAESSDSQMPTTAYSSTHALTSSCCRWCRDKVSDSAQDCACVIWYAT